MQAVLERYRSVLDDGWLVCGRDDVTEDVCTVRVRIFRSPHEFAGTGGRFTGNRAGDEDRVAFFGGGGVAEQRPDVREPAKLLRLPPAAAIMIGRDKRCAPFETSLPSAKSKIIMANQKLIARGGERGGGVERERRRISKFSSRFAVSESINSFLKLERGHKVSHFNCVSDGGGPRSELRHTPATDNAHSPFAFS